MKFEVFQSEIEINIELQRYWNACDVADQDIHLNPGYLHLLRSEFQERHVLLVTSMLGMKAFQVLNIRKIPASTSSDAISPYGFGKIGVLNSKTSYVNPLFNAHFANSLAFLCQNNYASEVMLLNPCLNLMLIESLYKDFELVGTKPVVVLKTNVSDVERISKYSRGHKSSLNRARRLGVQVIDANLEDKSQIDIFKELHRETMDRSGASIRWRFGESFFFTAVERIGVENCKIFHAKVGEDVAASHFVLLSGRTMYYFFGGSNREFNSYRPSCILVDEICKWGNANGFDQYVLGGGVTDAHDDTLLHEIFY